MDVPTTITHTPNATVAPVSDLANDDNEVGQAVSPLPAPLPNGSDALVVDPSPNISDDVDNETDGS